MSNIEIKKAKVKNAIFLAYEYVEKTENYENKISTASDAPIHEDLRNAFDALIPHFALLTEEVSKAEVNEAIQYGDKPECLDKFSVSGFTLAGTGDTEGVVISGHKSLESGKVVNFNTPFQLFDDEDYDYSEELVKSIESLKNEVFQYMEGKQAPRMQVGSFDFEDEDEAFALPAGINPVQELLEGLDEAVSIEVSVNGTTKKLGRGKKKAAGASEDAEE